MLFFSGADKSLPFKSSAAVMVGVSAAIRTKLENLNLQFDVTGTAQRYAR